VAMNKESKVYLKKKNRNCVGSWGLNSTEKKVYEKSLTPKSIIFTFLRGLLFEMLCITIFVTCGWELKTFFSLFIYDWYKNNMFGEFPQVVRS
jgi:hypothetical protein